MFDNADLVALVHDQEFAPPVARRARTPPGAARIVVIDDGSERHARGVRYERAGRGVADRDFGPRSNDDLYILYTGGTTGHPKGVMWRHEDIWRTLGGGIDFITGEPLADEWEQSRSGAEERRHGPAVPRRRSSTAPRSGPR